MIGFGYDIHRLAPGIPLILGGVTIPSDRGTVAHSDGDVLLHALCDALLGAAALGDIGQHFSDSNTEFRGISSLELLRRVMVLIENHLFKVVNVDSTIILERPKLASFMDAMRENIAPILGVSIDRVSVKATTNEGMGELGSGDAIAVHAVVQLESV